MENKTTVQVGDKILTLKEYKIKEIKRVMPLGLLLGALLGCSFSGLYKKNMLKYCLLGGVAGVITSGIILQNKFDRIGK